SMAFFRFYFDADDDAARVKVVRTSFWFTMTAATAGLIVGVLLAGPISEALFGTHSRASLVRAAFVLLWAQMNYEQLTSLFRVEERSFSYVAATLANVIITVVSTILLDRKSTRLNSSHQIISYADFCLKKKNTKNYQ